jgi:transposase
MIQIEFTQAEIDQLHEQRTTHPHPRVRQRMEVLYLKALKLPHQEIYRITRISPKTLRGYLHLYQQGGIEALKQLNFYQPQSELQAHETTIRQAFEGKPPATVKEARAKIKELTGLQRSLSQIRAFMKKIGLKLRKVGQIPAKADPDKQKAFLDEELTPRLEAAKQGKRHLFFVDAAHFVLRPFLGFVWCFVRLFIKAPAGRQRYNVLGALHATTRRLVTVTNESYINALSVMELLKELAGQFTDAPITLVMDNARYQRCKVVMAEAKRLGIELLFLPSYSPNLNLIERLWKFVKKKALYSEYYQDFTAFKKGINDCLDKMETAYQAELASLLSLNFQTFENVTLCPC